MKCLHSITAVYTDALGVAHTYERPCGRCIACLHNKQDSIAIRALETTKQFPMFVYDTLTFSPGSLPLRSVSEQIKLREQEFADAGKPRKIVVSNVVRKVLNYYSSDGSLVPVVERDIIRNWLKSARVNFVRKYGRNANWKYLIYLEYGPQKSRPHFHLLFWNISKKDYDDFLGTPWKKKYGFTKPAYFNGNSTQQDRECITRYISKYVSKGVFESPLVKCGLLPAPFHFYSQGLGLGYILKSEFDFFRSDYVEQLKSVSVNVERRGFADYADSVRAFLSTTEVVPPPSRMLDLLSVYYDSNSKPHALPRYYKQKLLNLLKPNVFSITVQNHLLARIKLYSDKKIEKFAMFLGAFGLRTATEPNSERRSILGLTPRLRDLLAVKFAIAEKLSAEISAKGRKTQLSNIYKRPVMGVNNARYGVTSNFLALVC